jgi:hypothetical protein
MVRRIDLSPVASEYERANKRSWGLGYEHLPITGLARWDTMRKERDARARRDLVLFAPTWRNGLNAGNLAGSESWRNIGGLAQDPWIHELLAEANLGMALFAHPLVRRQLVPALAQSTHHVEVIDCGSHIPSILARAALLITDYSSLAWDALYLGVPVAFFQFDLAQYMAADYAFVDLTTPLFGPQSQTLSQTQALLEQFHRADLRLIQTCEAFDFPITPRPPNVRYVGPVLDHPDWVGGWESPWRQGDPRPLVVVSLSSTFQNQRDVIRRIVSALGTMEVRGLVTLGPSMAGDTLDLPDNVITVASAAHTLVFPLADAVVTHAGHGTVLRALAHGLPLLCLPMGRDQDDNAARVVARGAGLRLRPSANPTRIAYALQRLLRSPDYRERAQRLARTIQEDVSADRVVQELESVAEGGVRQRA